MAVPVTGTLTDLGGHSIPVGLRPVLDFIPSRSGQHGRNLFTPVPVPASLTGNSWTAEMEPTDHIEGLFYQPRVRHFRADGGQHSTHMLATRVYVPVGGGDLGDFPGVPIDPMTVLVSLDPPPSGYRGLYLNAPGPGEPLGDPDDPASSGTGILEIVS